MIHATLRRLTRASSSETVRATVKKTEPMVADLRPVLKFAVEVSAIIALLEGSVSIGSHGKMCSANGGYPSKPNQEPQAPRGGPNLLKRKSFASAWADFCTALSRPDQILCPEWNISRTWMVRVRRLNQLLL